ncbi:hypothetical protein RRG08_064664 [Elysia crispata]|uniref:Hexosyltransferase n=1 Tax=Elysia crispata TaxID=231223 RepID=A0AAE1B9J1_9GAST|nr:hypothetical protein RRG08_064664 [Elysia crispata]
MSKICSRQRRTCRQTLIALAFLAMLTFALKLQHMVINLNQEREGPLFSDHARILSKSAAQVSRGRSRPEQDETRLFVDEPSRNEGKAFAQLGIKLVNLSLYDSNDFNFNFKFPSLNDTEIGAGQGNGGLKRSWISDAKLSRARSSSNQARNISSDSLKYVSFSKINSENGFRDIDKKTDALYRRSEIDKELRVKSNVTYGTVSSQRKDSFPDVYLVIIIVSRPDNMLYRLATRKTWARNARELGTVLRFMVGRDPHWDSLVEKENELHKDLIILEEDDVYDLLPTKVLEGFTWALRQEAKPQYVMKVDDDSMVNLPYLLTELHSRVINSTQILGAICKNAPVVRDPSDKWSVSVLDYPLDKYPTYAAGGGYVMSAEAAAALLRARSRTLGWFHLEDVYITGVLAAKAGLGHVAHPGFSYWSDEKAQPCDFLQNKRIVSVGHTDIDMNMMFAKTVALVQAGGAEACASLESSSPSNIE